MVKKNSRIPESASYVRDVPKPDVIVIEDDQKKRMEGFHRLDTGEGKQASSMLRMLASGGNGKLHSNYFGCVLPPLFSLLIIEPTLLLLVRRMIMPPFRIP